MKVFEKSTVILLVFFVMGLTPGIAQNVGEFRSLVGQSARNMDNIFKDEGYYHIKTDKFGYNIYSYWWNNSKKECVCANVSNGEVKSVVASRPADCNKSSQGNHHETSYNEHSSHHHDNNSHYSSGSEEGAYERGFSDGKYNKSYHNYYRNSNEKAAYSKGYSRGVLDRSQSTRHHSGRGGYANHERYEDVLGDDARSAYSQLERRGFREVKEHQNDGKTYRVWYNRDTDQCIKTVSQNKRISDVMKSTHCD